MYTSIQQHIIPKPVIETLLPPTLKSEVELGSSAQSQRHLNARGLRPEGRLPTRELRVSLLGSLSPVGSDPVFQGSWMQSLSWRKGVVKES